MSDVPQLGESLVSGPLSRQGGILGVWKQFFYRVEGDDFVEYESDKFDIEKNRWSLLPPCQILAAPEAKRPNCFKLVDSKKKSTVFSADNEEQFTKWFAFLKGKTQTEPQETPQKRVSLNDFEFIKVIGRGSYGKVSLVRYKENGKLYAMKSMSKRLLAEDNNIHQILIEREVLLHNQHPFLVSAHFTFQTDAKVFIVLDYVPGGELFGRLKTEGRISESRARLYAAEILLGLQHLHKLGFIYRDMKPENILVDADGHLKVTDFGFAKNNITNERQTTNTFCGTPEYLAPEVLRQQPYTRSVDWWSFGVILFEMLSGIPPFFDSNPKKMYMGILFEPIQFPSYFSRKAIDLIMKLMDRDSTRRLGAGPTDAEEIKVHPFFEGLNWDDVMAKKTIPQWIPPMENPTDTSNFDQEFTAEPTAISFEDPSLIPADAQAAFVDFTCNQEEQSVIDVDE